jgi:hypothetical protein
LTPPDKAADASDRFIFNSANGNLHSRQRWRREAAGAQFLDRVTRNSSEK